MNKLEEVDNFKILVASEDEFNKLIPDEFQKDTIITGIGIKNVIYSIHNLFLSNQINEKTLLINIGYAGSNSLSRGSVYQISQSFTLDTGTNYEFPDEFQGVNLLTVSELPMTNCYTSLDFVIENKHVQSVAYDMELAGIVSFGNVVTSLKVISDNLQTQVYDETILAKRNEEHLKMISTFIKDVLEEYKNLWNTTWTPVDSDSI